MNTGVIWGDDDLEEFCTRWCLAAAAFFCGAFSLTVIWINCTVKAKWRTSHGGDHVESTEMKQRNAGWGNKVEQRRSLHWCWKDTLGNNKHHNSIQLHT